MSTDSAAPTQPGWVVLLQLVTVAAGLVLGMLARPEAVAGVLATVLLQLVATVIGWRGIGGPVVYTGAVAAIAIGAAVHPALRELVHIGGLPYAQLGLALATTALAAGARTGRQLVLGAALLAGAVLALAGAATAQGAPAPMALLSSSVPVLAGGLVSVSAQLRRARQDRLTRRSGTAAPLPAPDRGRADSSLLTVAMLSEALGEDAPDHRTAARADQIRTIALRGLDAEPRDPADRVRIDVRVSGESPRRGEPPAPEAAEPPEAAPELSDREREIARLLTTGPSNAAIARELYLSEATIKGHVSRMMRRHDCENRTQLALLANRWSL